MKAFIFFILVSMSTQLFAQEPTCEDHLREFESTLASQRALKSGFFGATLDELLRKNFEIHEAKSLLGGLKSSSSLDQDIAALITGESSKYLKRITSDCDELEDDEDIDKCKEKLRELGENKEDFQRKNKELQDDMADVQTKIGSIKKSDEYKKLDQIAKSHALKFLRKQCHTDDSYTLYEIKKYGCNKSIPTISSEALALAGDVADAVVVAQTQEAKTETVTATATTTSSPTPLECPSGSEKVGNKCFSKCPELYLRDPADMKCVPDVEAQYAENQRIIENRKSWSKVAKIGGIVLAAGGAIGLAAWGISAIVDAENNAGGGTYTPTSYYNPYAGGYSSYYPGYSMPYYNPYMFSYPNWVGSQHNASNTPYSFEF